MDSSHGLNPAQHAAVHAPSGPRLVLAGAGTGKTRVVTYRVAQLIRKGIRPSRILAVTFTNKAADEMRGRATALLGRALKEKPEISTFHSLCVRILRRHAKLLGYPPQFAIYDRGDQESVARTALREIKVPGEVLRPSDALYWIGRWKTQALDPNRAAAQAQSDKEHLASLAYRRYQKNLRQAGAMDFDDLLVCTQELFERFADARRAETERFSHLLVDEYQDTNGTQYKIVKALAAGHRNLCVVGDDDQSIYGWRGADVAHILRFKHDWPDATVVRLEENYRSTAAILVFANRLIQHNRQRHDKILRPARAGGNPPRIMQAQDETDEARSVIDDIRRLMAAGTAQPRDVAILFRTNEQPRVFEIELRRAQVPYVLVGGTSFYDRKEVRDILAYLKLLVSPSDEVSLRRIINTPARGIGPQSVEALLAEAVARGKPLADVLPRAATLTGINAAAVEAIVNFQKLLDASRRQLGQRSLVEVVTELVSRIGYRDHINRLYDDEQDRQTRWSAVEEVINTLAAYAQRSKRATLGGFLDDLLLADRDTDRDKDEKLARNAVALMTLHSAKGLEFPHVYLVGMEEGLLPHHRAMESGSSAIDEERRLCYVGVTRAQDQLTLSLALARTKWGKLRPTKPSPFLYELTGQTPRTPGARRVPNSKPQAAMTKSRRAAGRRPSKTVPPKRRG